jgi:hypothetical protein
MRLLFAQIPKYIPRSRLAFELGCRATPAANLLSNHSRFQRRGRYKWLKEFRLPLLFPDIAMSSHKVALFTLHGREKSFVMSEINSRLAKQPQICDVDSLGSHDLRSRAFKVLAHFSYRHQASACASTRTKLIWESLSRATIVKARHGWKPLALWYSASATRSSSAVDK